MISKIKIKRQRGKLAIEKIFTFLLDFKIILLAGLISILTDFLHSQKITFFSKESVENIAFCLFFYSTLGISLNIFKQFQKNRKKYLVISLCLILLVITSLLNNDKFPILVSDSLLIIFYTSLFSLFLFPMVFILRKLFQIISLKHLIFFFILVFLSSWVFPAFIYNELEWQERKKFLVAEEVARQTDYLIGIRTSKITEVLLSDQEKAKLWLPIEKGLRIKSQLIEEYLKFLRWQDKIPFLPNKYKKYQELKKLAIKDYQKTNQLFSEVKKKEHQGYRLVQQLVAASARVKAIPEQEGWEEYLVSLKQAAEVAKLLKKDAEILYEEKTIDEGFRTYVQTQAQKIIDVYQFLRDPKNANDPNSFQRLVALLKKDTDQDFNQIALNWHKNNIDPLNQEVKKYHRLASQRITEADRYYRENDLKNDLISRLLSKITKNYPRNI